MSKKWMMVVAAACVCMQSVGVMAMDNSVSLAADTVVEISMQETTSNKAQEEQGMYTTKVGEITEINKENDTYEILVGSMTEGTRVMVKPATQVLDVETLGMLKVEELKVGMNVTVLLDKNAPMTMSLPPVCSAEAVILVNSKDKQVEVGYFDETLTNEAHTLALNEAKETTIQSITGERRIFTLDDVKNKEAVVVYTTSTRSIPAQTTPEYVLILSTDTEEVAEEVEEKSTRAVQAEEKYMAVREIVKEHGYTSVWDNKTKTAVLTKGEEKLSFTVGEKTYKHNGESVSLGKEVKLEDNTLYVPSEIVAVLE